jgi:hypothetical protein
MRFTTLLITSIIGFCACGMGSAPTRSAASNNSASAAKTSDEASTPAAQAEPASTPKPTAASGQPQNILDFFNLLPQKYFTLEGCYPETDKDCKKARAQYLKDFTVVEDIANGYFKGGCDGGQECIEMAIFKRPDGTYLVGVFVTGEMTNNNYFLDYSGGKWTDVGAKAVLDFSDKLIYELPRVGTTVKVYEKKVLEHNDEFDVTERGKKLYDLVWKDGKFTKK